MKKIAVLSIMLFSLSNLSCFAIDNKVDFNNKSYNLFDYTEKPIEYEYYLPSESQDKWSSRITLSNISNMSNTTEACADLAHSIQQTTPGASVLVYPDISMLEYINFPENREYYEYSAIIFQPPKKDGVDVFKFSKRFYSDDLDGKELARDAAIEFAQKNSTKYMQMVNKVASSYKVD
ncbi:MAG: hypothetical protein R3Y28_01255 [Candidatus Gastranaerophilales bacterium]